MGVFMFGELEYSRKIYQQDLPVMEEVLEVYEQKGDRLFLKEEALVKYLNDFLVEFYKAIDEDFDIEEMRPYSNFSELKKSLAYENRNYELPYFVDEDVNSLTIYQDGGKFLMENDAILYHFQSALRYGLKNPLRHAINIDIY